MAETKTKIVSERIEDPVHGVSYAFEPEGDRLWVHTWMHDGGQLPEHFHPSLEERWEVVDGVGRMKLDGTWIALTPADGPVVVPPNVKHELCNESGSEARLRTEVIPAGRLQDFLVESARAAREGLYNRRNLPTGWRGLVWAADFSLRFHDETVMTSPPPALQRALMPLFARFARGN